MTTTELISFHGDTLQYVEHDGVPFVAVKPMCERLGIAWTPQFRKLQSRLELWGVAILAIPSAGGEQETTCLPVNRIAMFLASIHANKVAEHLREPLIRYQIEAADVLDRHFRQRWDDRTEEVAVLKAMLERCQANLLVEIPQWAKIRILHDADVWRTSAARRLKMSDAVFDTHFEEMQRCGILPAGRWEAGDRDESWFGAMRRLQWDNSLLKDRLADAELRAYEASQALPPPEPEVKAEPEPEPEPEEGGEGEVSQ